MTEANNLLLDLLRQIRGDIAAIRRKQDEHSSTLTDIRLEFHAIRGEQLRQQLQAIAVLETDMDRVNRHLDLHDEPPSAM